MLFLQIRQAETALADGRLDEAYRLVQFDALRSHRRGQAVVTGLVGKLIERARAHLQGGRPMPALLDCDKAQTLGGNLDHVLALRSEIEQVVTEADRGKRGVAQAGALEKAAALVDSAIGRNDLDRAVGELVRARVNGCDDRQLRQLDANVRNTLLKQVETALNDGRLDEIESLMDRLARLDPEGLATQRLARSVEQARSAWMAIELGQMQRASELLHRLTAQLPDAKWIAKALEQVTTAENSLRALRTGPLGLMSMNTPSPSPSNPPPSGPSQIPAQGEQLPLKFIVQVDGAGSYLVLRKPSVTIGPISSSRAPDVGLMTEPGAAVFSIERMDDDYFLRTAGGQSKLLSPGDRVELSPRCRLTFGLPNPSSTSASLDLISGRFPRGDLRRIILLDRDLIIGPGANAHIRADQLSEQVVLNVREGRLWCKNQQMEPAKPVTVAGISMVVTAT